MAFCKGCGLPIEWGYDEASNRFVPLEPEATDGDMVKTFRDAYGKLRADHRDRHDKSKPTVKITRLDVPVRAKITPIRKTAAKKAPAAKKAAPRRRAAG